MFVRCTVPGEGNTRAHTSADQLTHVVVIEYGFFSSPNYVKCALSFPRIQTCLTVSQFLCGLVTQSFPYNLSAQTN